MTHEAMIYTALSGVFSGRLYPVMFPEPAGSAPPVWPAAVYTFVDSEAIRDICGGDDDDQTSIVQVRIDFRSAAGLGFNAHRALRRQVIAAMVAMPVPVNKSLDYHDFEPVTRTLRGITDWTLHESSGA